MKTKNINISSREISLRNREANLARLIAEVQMLRELVRLEEVKLDETAMNRKKVAVGSPHGGVSAAVDGQRRGLVDHWLHPIREVYRARCSELNDIVEPHVRLDRLCELNVIQQVRNVASDVFVLDAWGRGQKLAVHGWIYSISDGLIRDLEARRAVGLRRSTTRKWFSCRTTCIRWLDQQTLHPAF